MFNGDLFRTVVRLRGNDGGESSVGFARENKLIHPIAGFQTTSKSKAET